MMATYETAFVLGAVARVQPWGNNIVILSGNNGDWLPSLRQPEPQAAELLRAGELDAASGVEARHSQDNVPDWEWDIEVAILFWREQMKYAFSLPDITEARAYIDSLVFDPLSPFDGEIQPNGEGQPVKGQWFVPRAASQRLCERPSIRSDADLGRSRFGRRLGTSIASARRSTRL
jgi:hypothetical protein